MCACLGSSVCLEMPVLVCRSFGPPWFPEDKAHLRMNCDTFGDPQLFILHHHQVKFKMIPLLCSVTK